MDISKLREILENEDGYPIFWYDGGPASSRYYIVAETTYFEQEYLAVYHLADFVVSCEPMGHIVEDDIALDDLDDTEIELAELRYLGQFVEGEEEAES